MTGGGAASTAAMPASSAGPPTSTAVEAAAATATAAAANAQSEIDKLDQLVEMTSSHNNSHHVSNVGAVNANAANGRPPHHHHQQSSSPRPMTQDHHLNTGSVGGSSGHSGSVPSNPAGNISSGGGGNTSPFLVPRNPRDTVLTSGSPKRRIAAVNASSQSHTIGGRQQQQQHIMAATSLTGADLHYGRTSGIAAGRRGGPAVSGASSLGGGNATSNGSGRVYGGNGNAGPPRVVGNGNSGNNNNMMMPPPPPPPPQSTSSRGSNPRTTSQNHNHIILPPSMSNHHSRSSHNNNHNPSDPDAEEQAMFESRLCEDEYGVAVRKINHNGKSQLRYVRCIWLASSDIVMDALASGVGVGSGSPTKANAAASIATASSVTTGGGGGMGNNSSTGRRGRGRARSNTASGGNSVSSLMGRMVSAGRSRGRSLSRDPSVRRNTAGSSRGGIGGGAGHSLTGTQVPSTSTLSQNGAGGGTNGNGNPPARVVVEGPISSPGMAVHDDEHDEDGARLLETRQASLPLGLNGSSGGADAIDSTKHMRALAWGNKKKVRIPLNRFVCVRKGKTTDRTKRNQHSASRLLSLITDDPANPSLDIEAPTKLDRDKFAKAFARFLDVPLAAEEGGKGGGKQRRSAAAATVADGRPESKSYQGKKMSKKFISSAVSAPDLGKSPTSVLSGSAAQSFAAHPNGGTSAAAAASLLPPIQPAISGDDDGRMSFTTGSRMDASAASESKGPSLGGYLGNVGAASSSASGRPPLVSAGQSMSSSNAGVVHSMSSTACNALLSDAAMKRVEAEGEADDAALLFHVAASTPRKGEGNAGTNDNGNSRSLLPQSSAVGVATAAPTNQAVSPSIKIGHHHHHHHHDPHPHNNAAGEHVAEEGTVVSSLTQGFDQEIVEELHQALTELRAELEASRAEAARAVKVAEQAIQSAESCSSSDWNSTVTHKAAEAAAQAQKKSAEALAKQRLAEEKLASERKSAQYWRQQAEAAEQEAGLLTTRAVVAEVQKAEIEATLESERRKNAAYVASLTENYEASDNVRKAALADATERNRLLEIELNGTRTDLASRSEEAKMLQDTLSEVTSTSTKGAKGKKMPFGMGRKKGHVRGNSLLSGDASSVMSDAEIMLSPSDNLSNGQLTQLHADTQSMKHQLEVLRRTTVDELSSLPEFAREWVGRAAAAVEASQTEARVLREKLAMESSMRRKLLNEVQDMKGNVRVYCRPQPRLEGATVDIASVPSSNVIVLHRDRDRENSEENEFGSPAPMSFEFDRVFPPESDQKEIYSEVEELALGALDGFNICLMAYGQNAAGKSRTILGDYEISLADPEAPSASIVQQGIHFMAAQQLFTVAEHRADRYQDCFTLNIVEVHDDKLRDLLAGTRIAEESGQVQVSPPKSRKKNRGADDGSASASKTGSKQHAGTRLEIRTNYDGDTVVQGAITVEVKSFDDVCRVWQECLIERSARLSEQGIDEDQYVTECHVIATLSVVSTNVSTGIGTSGKIQFVDLASSDLEACYVDPETGAAEASSSTTPMDGVLSGVGNNSQWKYADKSLETLLDVVTARSQFSRSVPYRDSTLTHLLRDSFTSDTKFLFLASVSTDADDLQNTASALRFASLMRKVNVGIATKHTVSLA